LKPIAEVIADSIPAAEAQAADAHRNAVALAVASALVGSKTDQNLGNELAALKAAAAAGDSLPSGIDQYRSKLSEMDLESFAKVGQ
jgi:putative NIF3 family GTP cyclohydrolase 1 type 2